MAVPSATRHSPIGSARAAVEAMSKAGKRQAGRSTEISSAFLFSLWQLYAASAKAEAGIANAGPRTSGDEDASAAGQSDTAGRRWSDGRCRAPGVWQRRRFGRLLRRHCALRKARRWRPEELPVCCHDGGKIVGALGRHSGESLNHRQRDQGSAAWPLMSTSSSTLWVRSFFESNISRTKATAVASPSGRALR